MRFSSVVLAPLLGWAAIACSDGPTWEPLEDLPAGCQIESATNPESVIQVEWETCGEGCLELTDRDGSIIGPGYHDGERVHVPYLRRHGGAMIFAVVAVDGEAVAAWRVPDSDDASCTLSELRLGDGAVAFVAQETSPSGSTAVFHSLLSQASQVRRPLMVVEDPIGRFAVSAEAVAFGGWHDGVASLHIATDRAPTLVAEGGEGLFADLQLLDETGVWLEDGLIRYASSDQPPAVLYEPDGATDGRRVSSLRSDGRRLVWTERWADSGSGDTVFRHELWASVAAASPDELSPRPVASNAVGADAGEIGGEHFGYVTPELDGTQTIVLLHLETGESRRRMGFHIDHQVLWTSEHEIGQVRQRFEVP